MIFTFYIVLAQRGTVCTCISHIHSPSYYKNIYISFFLISEEEYFFEVAEAVFVVWFTFEYVIRFIAAPQKLRCVL